MFALLLLAACGGTPTPPPDAPSAPSDAPEQVEPPTEAPPIKLPAGVSQELFAQLCTDPCAGEVEVWRNVEAKPGRLVFKGDIDKCSHVMHVVYDLDGSALWEADDRPATKDEAAEIAAKKEAVLAGHQLTETLDCPSAP